MTYQTSGPNLQHVHRVLAEYREFLHAQPNVVGSWVCMTGKLRLCIRLELSRLTEGLALEVGGVKVINKIVGQGKIAAGKAAEGEGDA